MLEDSPGTLGSELRCEAASLLPAPTPALVRSPHLVRPAIALGDGQPHIMFSQHPGEPFDVGGARVGQRGIDPVTQLTLEPARGELFAPLLPVRQCAFGRRQRLKAVLSHDLVVDLMQATRPTGVPGQRATREIVVVDDVDVSVQVVGVVMHRDEVVSRVHGLGQRTRHLPDPIHVPRVTWIELGRREREHIVL